MLVRPLAVLTTCVVTCAFVTPIACADPETVSADASPVSDKQQNRPHIERE